MLLDNRPRIAITKFLALENSAGIDLVLRFSRHELHCQQELKRNQTDVAPRDARLAPGRAGFANGIAEKRCEVKAAVDEIDAQATLTVANANTCDAKRSDLGDWSSQAFSRGLSSTDRNRKNSILRRARNAPRIERQSTDEREFGTLLLQRRSRGSNGRTRIERVDFPDN